MDGKLLLGEEDSRLWGEGSVSQGQTFMFWKGDFWFLMIETSLLCEMEIAGKPPF